MKDVSLSVRVSPKTETVFRKSVSSYVKRSDRWYARIPASVLLDKSLKPDAVRIYGLLALSVYQGSVTRVGIRQLGRVIGRSPATVSRRLSELVANGHVKTLKLKNGQRAWYELTSPVFGQKQGHETVVVRGQSGAPRFASIAKVGAA